MLGTIGHVIWYPSKTYPSYPFLYSILHTFQIVCTFNRENPLGLEETMAKRYADLVRDLWSGKHKSIVPLKFQEALRIALSKQTEHSH